ncbi:hypothetical protein KSP39_PZI021125 [Platanthera zijinensis]|uniref:Uncharacterized protein n=1 Tax=Platanthera zijinensis TaxID=2320716 RepID=A0AAP0AX25_9ASPA
MSSPFGARAKVGAIEALLRSSPANPAIFVLAWRTLLVVHDRRLSKKFSILCLIQMKDSYYLEEHYFPILLDVQNPEGCIQYSLTGGNWIGNVGGHRRTYTAGEVLRERFRGRGLGLGGDFSPPSNQELDTIPKECPGKTASQEEDCPGA